ncbi:MAG: hypothetical protein ACREGG_00055 [Candidatus Saccharimonadales bacterium]
MRAVILYHPGGEFAGLAEDYKRDFETRHQGKEIELLSLEEAAGAEAAKLYDVVRYPALLVISNDGSLLKLWQDQPWPVMDEVSSYLQ